jgi:hypothetical protein
MYRWTKVWAVQTDAADEVAVGDVIPVGTNGGESKQEVVSNTVMLTKKGQQYRVLLTREVTE